MAKTLSNMLPLGTRAPDFTLPDTVSNTTLALADIAQGRQATLVMFICNHCPYVKLVNAELVRLARDYLPRGVGIVAISSNDAANYPDDAPDKMKAHAKAEGYPFPYLYDESQAVAKAYQAACTPDFYLFNAALKLAYRGRLDGATPGNGMAVTGEDLRAALDAVLGGHAPSAEQKPSMGCNIKWRT